MMIMTIYADYADYDDNSHTDTNNDAISVDNTNTNNDTTNDNRNTKPIAINQLQTHI